MFLLQCYVVGPRLFSYTVMTPFHFPLHHCSTGWVVLKKWNRTCLYYTITFSVMVSDTNHCTQMQLTCWTTFWLDRLHYISLTRMMCMVYTTLYLSHRMTWIIIIISVEDIAVKMRWWEPQRDVSPTFSARRNVTLHKPVVRLINSILFILQSAHCLSVSLCVQ